MLLNNVHSIPEENLRFKHYNIQISTKEYKKRYFNSSANQYS